MLAIPVISGLHRVCCQPDSINIPQLNCCYMLAISTISGLRRVCCQPDSINIPQLNCCYTLAISTISGLHRVCCQLISATGLKTIVFDGEKKCNKKEGGPHCTQSNNTKYADKLQTKLCNQALQVKQVHNSKLKKKLFPSKGTGDFRNLDPSLFTVSTANPPPPFCVICMIIVMCVK